MNSSGKGSPQQKLSSVFEVSLSLMFLSFQCCDVLYMTHLNWKAILHSSKHD